MSVSTQIFAGRRHLALFCSCSVSKIVFSCSAADFITRCEFTNIIRTGSAQRASDGTTYYAINTHTHTDTHVHNTRNIRVQARAGAPARLFSFAPIPQGVRSSCGWRARIPISHTHTHLRAHTHKHTQHTHITTFLRAFGVTRAARACMCGLALVARCALGALTQTATHKHTHTHADMLRSSGERACDDSPMGSEPGSVVDGTAALDANCLRTPAASHQRTACRTVCVCVGGCVGVYVCVCVRVAESMGNHE